MNKLKNLIFFLLIPIISYAQCDNPNSPTSVIVNSVNLEEVEFQFCYKDSSDFLIVTQHYFKPDYLQPKVIRSVEDGNYLLKDNRVIIFTMDNSRFQLKLDGEEKVYEVNEYDEVTVYSYYEITRNKLKFILLGTIEVIDIIKDDEIQTFDVSYSESADFYQMTYRYFKYKKWR